MAVAMPDEERLPPGPVRDLVAGLHRLYRQAGMPSTRKMSEAIEGDDGQRDSVSHETAGAMLRGAVVPRWTQVEALVRMLASTAVNQPNLDSERRRIHELWLRARGVSTPAGSGISFDEHVDLKAAPSVEEDLQVDISASGDVVLVVRIAGELDLSTVETVSRMLRRARQPQYPNHVLDLREVKFIDSAVLSLLGVHRQWLKSAGLTYRTLCSPQVYRILSIVGLQDSFNADPG